MNNDLDLIYFVNNRTGSIAVSIDDCDTIVAPNGRRLALNEDLWEESDNDANDLTAEQAEKLLDIIATREGADRRDKEHTEKAERHDAECWAHWNSPTQRTKRADANRIIIEMLDALRAIRF